jgi:Lrp/AsnC family leucine-responsive transcriptional regulator
LVRVKKSLDAMDIEILKILSSNCREKLEDIASKVGLSSPMVRKRIEIMEKLGIIRGCVARIDMSMLEGVSSSLVLIRHRGSAKLAESLYRHPAVERVYISRAGDTIVALIRGVGGEGAREVIDMVKREVPEAEIIDVNQIYEKPWIPEKPGISIIYRCGFCGGVIIGSPYVLELGDGIKTFHGRECAEAYLQKKRLMQV